MHASFGPAHPFDARMTWARACPAQVHVSWATDANIYYKCTSEAITYTKLSSQLEDVVIRKSRKEHGYYITVTSLDKIGEDRCLKHGIFLKYESFERIFLSTRRRNMSSTAMFFFDHLQSI